MSVDAHGALPEFPIPGKKGMGNTVVFPPYSYAYVAFPGAGVAACKAT